MEYVKNVLSGILFCAVLVGLGTLLTMIPDIAIMVVLLFIAFVAVLTFVLYVLHTLGDIVRTMWSK